MKNKTLFVTLASGLSLTMVLLWVMGAQNSPAVAAVGAEYAQAPNAPADELHVCPSGPPDCQYNSIQEAVDAASGLYPIIKVAAGTYTGVHARPRNDIQTTGVVTQVVYLNKPLALEGGYTTTDWMTPDPVANPTILDAQSQGRVIYITHDNWGLVQGLHITGGNDSGLGGFGDGDEDAGGGVYGFGIRYTLRDNLISGNLSNGRGGGLSLNLDSDSLFEGNIVWNNTALRGGGMNLGGDSDEDPLLRNNMFYFNTAAIHGGGLYVLGPIPTLSENTIVANTATDGYGGGIFLGFSDAVLTDNTVISNAAQGGGGLHFIWSSPTLVNNVIADNQASLRGSGLQMVGASPRLLHTTMARNRGGDGSAIYVDSPPDPASYTLAMTNTILVSHTVGILVTGGNTVTVNGVLWYGTPVTVSGSTTASVTVLNQTTGDPAFASDGYHITADSAAIDQGVEAGIPVDMDGEPRPAGTGYDLGADELWFRLSLPLVLRDG